MRYLLFLLIVVIIVTGSVYYQQKLICWKPLAYDIGNFDESFNITREKFAETLKEGELVWENDIGKNLFDYQSGAKFKINLIFDDRQRITVEGNQSKEEIEESRSSYDRILNQYEQMEASYKFNLSVYESDLKSFDQKLSAYNLRVSELNTKGGATPREYRELEDERKYLESLKTTLDSQRLSLNADASRLNFLGDQVNDLAQKLNIDVDIHNQLFGGAREFDQGEYVNGRINIYQFDTISDLRLVIAHEFGHAIGLNHVENPESIMYYLMEEQNLQNTGLTEEDIEAFRSYCGFSSGNLKGIFSPSQLFQHIRQFQY